MHYQLNEIREIQHDICKKYYDKTNSIFIEDYSKLFDYNKFDKLISENINELIKSCTNSMNEHYFQILYNDTEFVSFFHQFYINLEYNEFMSKVCNLIYNSYFVNNVNNYQRSINDRYVAKLDKVQSDNWDIIDKFIEYVKSNNYDYRSFDTYSGLALGPKPAI
jgi:hypothetical protein